MADGAGIDGDGGGGSAALPGAGASDFDDTVPAGGGCAGGCGLWPVKRRSADAGNGNGAEQYPAQAEIKKE